MTRLIPVFFAFIALTQAQGPRRVLYLTHSAGFRHDSIAVSRQSLAALSPRLEITATEDLTAISADNLRNYSAVLFFTSGELALSPAQRIALLEFVRGGGGFGGVHSATDTLYTWPEYGELIGGYFDGHPWVQPVRIDIEDPGHPATKHLASPFEILEEIYQFRAFDRSRVRVLMTLDTTSVDRDAAGAHTGTEDFPLAWVRSYGSGRVFYSALGHFDETWRDARFLEMMKGALLWLTGEVEGEAAVRPTPPAQVSAVANAASGTPANRIAPGSLISIYGSHLTSGSAMAGQYGGRLAGSAVRLNGRRLSLLYASPGQINAMVPKDQSQGDATLTIEPGGGSRHVEIPPSSPGVFAVTAQRGAVIAWATGLGDRIPLARLNGQTAPILFAGDAPGFPGLNQINIVAPAVGRVTLELSLDGAVFHQGLVDLPE